MLFVKNSLAHYAPKESIPAEFLFSMGGLNVFDPQILEEFKQLNKWLKSGICAFDHIFYASNCLSSNPAPAQPRPNPDPATKGRPRERPAF
jgi:hypothetical protein